MVVPDSFSTLPEYSEDGEKATVTSTELLSSAASSPISGYKSVASSSDPNVVILKTFEDATRRSPSAGRASRISPTSEISDPFCALSLSPIFDPLPSPDLYEEDKLSFFDTCLDGRTEDQTLFSHFRHVVWKQLFPHDREQDDSFGLECSGMTLSVDFLEREAAHFPPVSILLDCLGSFTVLIIAWFSARACYYGCLSSQSVSQWDRAECRCSAVLPTGISLSPKQPPEQRRPCLRRTISHSFPTFDLRGKSFLKVQDV